MFMRKWLIVVPLTLLLSGCANTARIERLTADIQTLNERVNQLQHEIDLLRPDVQAVEDEAEDINSRIDNSGGCIYGITK